MPSIPISPCGDSRRRLSSRAKLGRVLLVAATAAGLVASVAAAQNPVPQIVGPVKPMAVLPGSGPFTLTVYGANFVPGSVVNWNYQPRSTTFISAHEVQAQILATDVAKNTAGLISVTNPPPGGGSSSAGWAQVEVHTATKAMALNHYHQYPVGDWLLMAADFNHDGILDLVGEVGTEMAFYKGNGDGTFHFGSIAGGDYPGGRPGAYGDFNNDGNLDFVFGNTPPNIPDPAAAVRLGDGHGGFKFGSAIYEYEAMTDSFAVGDFNGDGNLDLIASGPRSAWTGFSVLLGNGNGRFHHLGNVGQMTFGPQEIVAGDFNGDGKLDVAVLVNPGGGLAGTYLYMFLGNGDGTFQPQQTIISTRSISGVRPQVSDFNGDGKLDLAFQAGTQIFILLGNGDGTFQPAITLTADQEIGFDWVIGDFNSDGIPDLFVSHDDNVDLRQYYLFLGNGDGTFQPPQVIDGLGAGLPFVVGDFNSDGLLDFITPDGGGMEIFTQK